MRSNKVSGAFDNPASARQRLLIARLCMKLKIREPVEERPMSVGEAGVLIRELLGRIRSERLV